MAKRVGVILAGGRATRLGGGDKALLRLGGATLLARLQARLAPQLDALALSANGDPGRFADTGLAVLPDTLAGFPGPLAGVLAGLDWAAAQGAGSLLAVAVDTPFVPPDLVARLAQAGDFALAASPDETGRLRRHPTVGLWPLRLRGALAAALARGAFKMGRWAEEQGATLVSFDERPDPFFNINTPEDLAQAARLLEGGEAGASPRTPGIFEDR